MQRFIGKNDFAEKSVIAGSARILACYVAESGEKSVSFLETRLAPFIRALRSAHRDACAPSDKALFFNSLIKITFKLTFSSLP